MQSRTASASPTRSSPAIRGAVALLAALLVIVALLVARSANATQAQRSWDHARHDGWQLDVLSADHLRIWKVEGGSLKSGVSATDLQIVRTGGDPIAVAALGAHDYPVDKIEPPWPGRAVMRHELYVRLAEPLREGEGVRVLARLPVGTLKFAATYTGDRESSFLKVNQVGYLPADSRKTAYLGGYLGSLGALPVTPTSFEVVEAGSGRVVWKGRMAAATVESVVNGETVARLPFGALADPGHYVVRVAGVGSSPAFLIDPDVYALPFREGLRAFYNHRCGVALQPAYTEYVHAACHTGATEGVFDSGLASTPLYGGEPVGGHHDASGGWHDASDWGKYIPTAAAAIYEILRLADLAPDLLVDGYSEIPESGNGVPDLLDEVAWELDWFLKMQRADGGVYHKLTGQAWNTDRAPTADTQTRSFAEVTTHDSARAAAVLALGARHLRPYDPERAARYEQAALRSWEFLQAHPDAIPAAGYRDRDWNGGGEYGDRFGDGDERAWAAVELYRLTGDPKYHQAFLAILPDDIVFHAPPVVVRDWPPLFEDSWRYALWSYSQLPAELGPDGAILSVIRSSWEMRARELSQRSDAGPYGLSFTAPYPEGTFGFGDTNGIWYARDLLLAAFQLGPDQRHVAAALANLDFFLGANGQGRAYMTGMGTHPVANIEYKLDEHDGVESPLPGHPVDGPSANVFWANADFEDQLYPNGSAYPPMQRYFDFPDPVMNEPVVDEMGTTLIPLGLLASPAARAWLLGG